MAAGNVLERAGRAAAASRLLPGEWLVGAGAVALALSMFGLEWFAYSIEGAIVPGSGGDAFRWLDGPDQLILACAVLALAALLLRLVTRDGGAARETAFVTGAAGLVAMVLVAASMVSPPDLDAGGLGALAGTDSTVRAGAVIGLLATVTVVVASARTITRSAEPQPEPRETPRPTQPRPAPQAKPKPKRAPAPPPPPAAEPGLLSLATATADDLVAVGFSRTQANRIVAYRDEEAIVTKVADLKRVPGIAKPVLAKLVERLED